MSHDEYLWSGQGEADPLLADLERTLGSLGFDGEPQLVDDLPRTGHGAGPTSRLRTWSWVGLGAAAAAMGLWWHLGGAGDPVVHRPRASAPVVPPVAAGNGEPGAARIGDANGSAIHGGPPVGIEPGPTDAPGSGPDRAVAPASHGEPDVRPARPEPKPRERAGLRPKAKSRPRPSSRSGGESGAAPATPESAPARPVEPRPSNPPAGAPDCAEHPGADLCPAGTETGEKLPFKLGEADAIEGLGPVLPEAQRCGRRHGAAPGTTVRVKLRVEGASGRVVRATAQSPHGGTPLGDCVAGALAGAQFRRFEYPSIGIVYPLKMAP